MSTALTVSPHFHPLWLVALAVTLGAPATANAQAAPEGSGAASGAPTPSAETAPSPGPDVAVVATDEGLWAIPLDGGPVAALTAEVASWCAVDNRAQVVWLAVSEAGGTTRLDALDLAPGAAPEAHVTVRDIPGELDAIIIDHGPMGRIGGTDRVSFFLGLRLSLVGDPSVGAEVGCDGDAVWYCGEIDESGTLTLNADLASLQARTNALSLADPAWMATLAARGGDRPLWSSTSPAPAGGAAPLRVEGVFEGCLAVPEDCGLARPLDGTPWWLVVVSNDSGDYFYESRQLYDPAAHEFVSALDGRRATTPLSRDGSLESVEGLLVAPSGRGFALAGRVAGQDGATVWAREDARPCGWLSGGYRVGGPRD